MQVNTFKEETYFSAAFPPTVSVKEISYSKKIITSTMLDAWGWCTGTAQRDGMGREEGGGFGMGNTCIPVADSF